MIWILISVCLLYLALQIMIVIELNIVMTRLEDLEGRVPSDKRKDTKSKWI